MDIDIGWLDGLWWLVIIALFILGYLGIILPVLPDMPFFWGGFVVYRFFINDVELSWTFWIIVHSITLFFLIGDFFLQGYLAKKYGGSNLSVWASIIAMIIAIPFGPLAIVLLPMAVIIVIELLYKKSVKDAFKVGLSSVLTLIFGTLFKLVSITGILIWFLIEVL